jgi:hypothetical protein
MDRRADSSLVIDQVAIHVDGGTAEVSARFRSRPGQASRYLDTLCGARTRTLDLSWRFRCLSGCSPVLADQAVDDLSVLGPGGHINRLSWLVDGSGI